MGTVDGMKGNVMERTPGRVSLCKLKGDTGGFGFGLLDEHNNIVAWVIEKDDAAYLVRVINCHNDLVRALGDNIHRLEHKVTPYQFEFEKMKALIAEAEGETE